jgi:hypothetical protein
LFIENFFHHRIFMGILRAPGGLDGFIVYPGIRGNLTHQETKYNENGS